MKRIALTIFALMAVAIQGRAAYWTPSYTATPNATWTAIAANATATAVSVAANATATQIAFFLTASATPVNTSTPYPTMPPILTPQNTVTGVPGYNTPVPTFTPNATWTYIASSYTLTPTPTLTPTLTPVYTPTTIPTPHPVQNNIVPNFSWRPPTRVDYLLSPNTSWTAITSTPCQLQPCIAELSIPETSAITWRYWRGSASATPTVPGDPALPADVVYPLALNPNETLWYKAVGATTISGSAQVSQ